MKPSRFANSAVNLDFNLISCIDSGAPVSANAFGKNEKLPCLNNDPVIIGVSPDLKPFCEPPEIRVFKSICSDFTSCTFNLNLSNWSIALANELGNLNPNELLRAISTL